MRYTNAALPSRPWFCEHRNTITRLYRVPLDTAVAHPYPTPGPDRADPRPRSSNSAKSQALNSRVVLIVK